MVLRMAMFCLPFLPIGIERRNRDEYASEMTQSSPAQWFRSVLILGVLASVCVVSAPAHAQATYVGTAHAQMERPGQVIIGTLHLTLHEDEHGHPVSVVEDNLESGAHGVFSLQFEPQHHFRLITGRGVASGVFTVHVQGENERHYYYHYADFKAPPFPIQTVRVNVHKVSTREISLSVDFDTQHYDLRSGVQLRATLHLKVPSSH
jgi:hypothetical protein